MLNKILVAVDRSPLGKSVFDSAVFWAKNTGANLMLLHVMSPKESEYPIYPLNTYYPLVEEIDYEQYHRQFSEYEQRGLQFLQNLTKEAKKAGIATEFTQLSGNPGRMICELANNWSADVVILGSRGLTGLKEMFLGSVSNYVTHHAPCSVLIVRQPVDDLSEQLISEQAGRQDEELLTSNKEVF